MSQRAVLSKAVIAAIAKAVEAGVPWEACGARLGVPSHTLKDWLRKGQALNQHVHDHGAFPEGSKKADWLMAELATEVEEAHLKAVEVFARKIRSASNKSWQAASWWLDRRAKDFFNNKPSEKEEKTQTSEAPQVQVYIPDNGRGPAK